MAVGTDLVATYLAVSFYGIVLFVALQIELIDAMLGFYEIDRVVQPNIFQCDGTPDGTCCQRCDLKNNELISNMVRLEKRGKIKLVPHL